jgi:hypothetical protein
LTWPELLGVEESVVADWEQVEFCRAHPRLLTEWERQFLDSIAGYLARGESCGEAEGGAAALI